MQFIGYGHPSSLKASFEIKLGSLNFNMVSESPIGCRVDLPPYYGSRILVGSPHVRGHIKMRVLSHIDQVFLGCAIYKAWTSLISQDVF